MKTTFETALNKHEISDFFKGDGIYFAKGSEWGDHLYISNWQEMCGVLKTQNAAQSLLTTLFQEYVQCLDENYEDAEGLFSNISAYYIARGMFQFLSTDNYNLIENLEKKDKENIGRLFRLLRKDYDRKNKDLPNYSFDQEIQNLKRNGCTIELEAL
ncbi:hypothetical protein ASC74_13470 [Pseudomonas sp. Root329]|uniref:DUF4375 domain-containing protein n=1 Tax=Pseudomonas fluorescens TaxID=294 RepID=A0A0F4SS10_PSEFL|nr:MULTISPECIES: hypothetical protein [Pseudomonas]KJZ34530.1 hypothetical protein VC34_28805 [Pseudomonas fluorescens]KQV10102.1 hypothetical protein ASC74_13470 [Pseudomonas sp. Root329]